MAWDIAAAWNSGDINSRATQASAVIDDAGTPKIIAPVQHGVRCLDRDGGTLWTYSGLNNGYDVRDLAVGNLNGTGYNDCTVVSSGYYNTSSHDKVGILDKDGNILDELTTADFTGAPTTTQGVALDGTDIYVSSSYGLHRFTKSAGTWSEAWCQAVGSCQQVKVDDMGNGKRVYVAIAAVGVKCYQTDGTLDWTITTSNQYTSIFAIGKTDSTKTGKQIVVPFQSGFYICDKDGNLSQNYTTHGNNVRTSVILYDCDGDGEDEIYYADMARDVFCIERTAANTYSLKYQLLDAIASSQYAGLARYDINNDGADEIFVYTTDGHCLIYDKTLATQLKDLNIAHGQAGGRYSGYQFYGNGISFADTSGDGFADLIIAGSTGYVDAFECSGIEAGATSYPATGACVVTSGASGAAGKQSPASGSAGITSEASGAVTVDSLRIERSDGDQDHFTEIHRTRWGDETWTDEGPFTDDVTYYYRVRRWDGASYGPYSAVQHVTYASTATDFAATGTCSISSATSGAANKYAPVSGACAITTGTTGSALKIAPVSGTCAITSGGSGSAIKHAPATGTCSMASGAAGSVVAARLAAATCNVVGQVTGSVVAVRGPCAGTTSITSGASGEAVKQAPVAGTSAITSSVSGQAARAAVTNGTAAIVSQVTGSAGAVRGPCSGTSAITSGASGTASKQAPAVGVASITSGAAGQAAAARTATGTVVIQSAGTGAANKQSAATGTAAVTSGAAGSAGKQAPVSGTCAIVSTSTGHASKAAVGQHTASGTCSITSGAEGSASKESPTAGVAAITSLASGSAGKRAPATGAASITSESAGQAARVASAIGTAAITSGASGAAAIARPATGICPIVSEASGSAAVAAGNTYAVAGTCVISSGAAGSPLVLIVAEETLDATASTRTLTSEASTRQLETTASVRTLDSKRSIRQLDSTASVRWLYDRH